MRRTRKIELFVLVVALLGCHRGMKHSGPSTPGSGTTASVKPDAGPPMPPYRVKGLDALAHKPLVALWEMNPWLMVIGSDVPSVVVYEDGLVILHRIVDRKVDRIEGHLSKVDALALASRVDSALAHSPARSELSGATDQPTVQILVRTAAGFREASTYGLSRSSLSNTAGSSQGKPVVGFVGAYKEIVDVNPPDPKPWVPETIEVMLWGFDYAKDAAPWPAGVPAPPASVVPPKAGVYHYDLPGRYEAAIEAHLKSNIGKATGFNGHRWSMSLRARVPEEDFLMTARSCGWAHVAARGKLPPECE